MREVTSFSFWNLELETASRRGLGSRRPPCPESRRRPSRTLIQGSDGDVTFPWGSLWP